MKWIREEKARNLKPGMRIGYDSLWWTLKSLMPVNKWPIIWTILQPLTILQENRKWATKEWANGGCSSRRSVAYNLKYLDRNLGHDHANTAVQVMIFTPTSFVTDLREYISNPAHTQGEFLITDHGDQGRHKVHTPIRTYPQRSFLRKMNGSRRDYVSIILMARWVSRKPE